MSEKKKSDQIVIPEDLSVLSDEDLTTLHDSAVEAFQAMYQDGDAPTDEALAALGALAEGIEAVKTEVSTRDAAALSRSTKAKDIASKILSADAETEAQPETDEVPEGEEPKEGEDENAVEDPTTLSTRRRRAIKIDVGALRSDRPPVEEPMSDGPKRVAFAAQGAAGYDVGVEVSISDMAKSINSRLGGFNAGAYAMARERDQRQSERFTIAKFPRKFPEGAVVVSEDPTDAMAFATNEKALPGGSLVASGGWCAPSETLYDLVDISEASNLISIPEIQINRGGIRHTIGPDYGAVYAATGFCYTEAQDIAGDYNGSGGGVKPCADVPCPPFVDTRLGYCGVCIGAGLLQQRGYPEVIEDYISKTLNAHAHRMSASVINSMAAAASQVTLPSQQGATAPILTAVDLQATHMRARNRMSDTATLEVVLPTWVKVPLRADLARRQGVDLLDVSDARINGWFNARNVSVQYVVDWQDIATTAASGFLSSPTGVTFLLYPAGAFVKGVTDSITFENIYDSVLLGTNDFTALFTEDPYLVAKRQNDVRKVTVPICADGATHIGVDIGCNGS